MILRFAFLLPVLGLASAFAQDRSPVEPASLPAPDQAVAPVKPSVEQLDENRYRIGKVILDKRSREIRFPAKVNMTEGLLEFVVVHENGKIHESLLATDISPTHLNLAFKLLRYPASRELYSKVNEDGTLSSEFEEASPEEKAGARIRIEVEYTDGGASRKLPVNAWINHAATERTMPAVPWIYGGSFVYNGKFVAESSGDVAAIFLSNAAIINFSGEDNENDEVWLPHPTRVPAEGTKVTLVIAPFEEK